MATRRDFIKLMGITGGGLVIGIPAMAQGAELSASGVEGQSLIANAFIQIRPDNSVHFYQPRSEMGQGINTGLTTLVAEELELAPEVIEIHHVGADSAYENPGYNIQVTGGSSSMYYHYLPIRQAAAQARELIRLAAVQQLKTSADQLTMRQGMIWHNDLGYPYGQFASGAQNLELDFEPELKKPEKFSLIGRDRPRLDGIAKSTGTAEFGVDIELPDLHHAVLVRCPVFGGTVKSYEAKESLLMPGVTDVVAIEHGVAVVAEHYWQAKKAAQKLSAEWDLPELANYSGEDVENALRAGLQEKGKEAHSDGDRDAALANSVQEIQAEYYAPYLAHATMEPMSCTARIDNGHCDIWVGSQSPGIAAGIASIYSGCDKDNVTVHSTFLGGGFGRRSGNDYVAEAVAIAKASNKTVKMIWSREDDTKHDYYRPASAVRMSAGLDQAGKISQWEVKRSGPNVMPYLIDESADAMMSGIIPNAAADWLSKLGHGLFKKFIVDSASVEGLFEDYEFPYKQVSHVTVDPGLRTGYWRSVGHSQNGFFKESFMDEAAHASGQDAVEFRLAHCGQDTQLHRVIQTAANAAGWGKAPAGRFHGIAAHRSFETAMAEVAEISITNNKITVHKVFCAVDCGLVINPDIVRAQVESGIIFALSAALYGEINLDKGAVRESNFHDYPVVRLPESPQIEVQIIDSQEAPTGIGEPAVPPLAPAVANAVFAATGQRLRRLPLSLETAS
ncbi:MAG: molybdopterin cofactor-binding domain-containing protein [Pseudomonadales bacterium]